MSASSFGSMSAASPANLVAVTWMVGFSAFHLSATCWTSCMPSLSGRRCRYWIFTASAGAGASELAGASDDAGADDEAGAAVSVGELEVDGVVPPQAVRPRAAMESSAPALRKRLVMSGISPPDLR